MSPEPRRVRIDLAYDGTDFCGWQIQPGRRTVQGVLEAALGRIQGERPVRVRGAGRTDTGVHARMQVCDCELTTKWNDDQLAHALHGMLPPDLRPTALRTVDAAFDSQRHALEKTYRYSLDLSRYGNPRAARFAVHHPATIERERLEAALSRLVGRRDWSGFAGAACEVEDRVRNLSAAIYEQTAERAAHFTFTADGFLNHMVRNIVGTLLEIARGRFSVERVGKILESGDRKLAGPTAPPRGLCLWQIVYPGDTAAG